VRLDDLAAIMSDLAPRVCGHLPWVLQSVPIVLELTPSAVT